MFLKHPAWLWLKKHDKSKLPPPDDNLQATLDEGKGFEKYAQKKFPKGIDLGFENYNEYLSLPERTRKALKDGAETIFQARFETDTLTCICDVLDIVGEDTFDLYEIKASTKVKPEHYPDLAFQTVVLEAAGYKVKRISVIHVNNEYVRKGEIDINELVTETDITNEVREIIEETRVNIEKALEVIKLPKLSDPSPRHAKLGSFYEWLDIYKGLGKRVDPYSIYNLASPNAKLIGDLEDAGISLIKDVPEDFKLNPKQLAQVLATKSGARSINRKEIRDFVETLTYPLQFLDYETATGAVPLYDGTRPYQQVPFQYSLHTIEKRGAKAVHSEYLHREGSHPVPPLLAKLEKDIDPSGTILVWYKNFEMSRNNEMAEMFPEFAKFLEDLNGKVVDLMEPFAQGFFVDKDFLGSASIKNVLPVLVPSLSYKNLNIQEGATAQRLWMDAVFGVEGQKNDIQGEIKKEKLFRDLVEYCKLDTLAMVEIWCVLVNLVEKPNRSTAKPQ